MRPIKPSLRTPHGLGATPPPGTNRLRAFDARDNPGKLRAFSYVPDSAGASMPLVVVLHGCTQSAAGYDAGSGWSILAERHGFALLIPEQARGNNPNNCFNWFSPADVTRGKGEAASIAAMVETMLADHAIDPARIFVTGLSAGGAMAAAMLATYPEMFAGGAIIAGLPFGCAAGVPEALACMAQGVPDTGSMLGDRVRAASTHRGAWPRVSVWHGDADRTVAAANADASVRQWADVHGLGGAVPVTNIVNGHVRQSWRDASGRVGVERYAIGGLGHGTPLRPGTGAGRAGRAGPFMLDAGISSTDRIAAFFGVAPAVAEEPQAARTATSSSAIRTAPEGPNGVIERALRAAGLMH